MKMFLASDFSQCADLFEKKVKSGKKVLVVGNPADPYKRKPWVKKDKLAFESHGFVVNEVDLRKITRSELRSSLYGTDIIHICGGSVVYIMNLLRERNMMSLIREMILHEEIVYTGTSAGSIIMAKDVSFCLDDEDEQEVNMVGKLKNTDGFGLVPFYMICHFQDKYYIPSTKNSMDRLPKYKYPILFLRDGMAVWVEYNQIEILNTQ